MIKVKSISDVITNSSSEVFIIKTGKPFEFYKERLKKEGIDIKYYVDMIIETEEDLEKFLASEDFHGEWRWEKGGYGVQNHMGPDIGPDIDFFGSYYDILEYMRDVKGYTKKEISNFIKDAYRSCIGYAFISLCNEGMDGELVEKFRNCYIDTEKFQDICENGYKPGDKDIPVEITYCFYNEETKKVEEGHVILKSYITDDWEIFTPTNQPGVPEIIKEKSDKAYIKSIKIKKDDKH